MPTIDNIPKRQLGTNGPLVPAIGFGLMSLAGIYGSADDNEERLKVLDHAYKIGARFWDTSEYAWSLVSVCYLPPLTDNN